jgi:immune inhibitor A
MRTSSDASTTRSTVTIVVVIVVAVLVLLLACLCCCGVGAALGVYWLDGEIDNTLEPTPVLSDFASADDLDRLLEQRIADTPTTNTNYWILHGQLRSEDGKPATREPIQAPTEYQAGDVHTFWMSDEEEQRYWQIDAELAIKTEHTYLYVDTEASVSDEKLQEAAEMLENQIHPATHSSFGSEWMPGIDNDPRVTILVTGQMPAGIAGYFSSVDEYPRSLKPHSNQREMIYVTSSYLGDLDLFGQLLSHELQHMIHWNQDQSEALWVNEGLSLLSEEINGYESVLGGWAFWRDTDMQLTNWAEESDDRQRNYAASKLFLSYLVEHYGGYEISLGLVADDAYGIDGVDNALRTKGFEADFEAVFADWVVANLINDGNVGDGRYSYALRGPNEPRITASLSEERQFGGWVSQFGADYVEIDPQLGKQIVFQGSGRVRLAGGDPHDGKYAWWSNRRNMLDSSLTHELDLSDTHKATLHFWTWYDIEEHFDYGYVAVSTDGGRTWEMLPGTHTTSEDPNKSSYGHGYTGKSHGWLEERVDLSPYAGQRILLRFWHISDPGLNQPGWLIDDISIPEVGFSDGGEQEAGGWVVDGFVRSSNYVPQSYVVQLVEYGPQTTVRRLRLDGENRGEFELGDETERAVVIISGATRWTSERAPYHITIE